VFRVTVCDLKIRHGGDVGKFVGLCLGFYLTLGLDWPFHVHYGLRILLYRFLFGLGAKRFTATRTSSESASEVSVTNEAKPEGI